MPRFVVHEHHASHLHWDLRLEMDGVLKSWALPKLPPTDSGVRRLAIQVEDHPLDYADFEGEIEEGYGKGTVSIWDSGTYELESRSEDLIRLVMSGERLKGRYKLVFTGYGRGDGWLFMKGKEGDAAPADASQVGSRGRSAASGKSAAKRRKGSGG